MGSPTLIEAVTDLGATQIGETGRHDAESGARSLRHRDDVGPRDICSCRSGEATSPPPPPVVRGELRPCQALHASSAAVIPDPHSVTLDDWGPLPEGTGAPMATEGKKLWAGDGILEVGAYGNVPPARSRWKFGNQ